VDELRWSSLWWNDVSFFGTKEGPQNDWFAYGVAMKVGDGN